MGSTGDFLTPIQGCLNFTTDVVGNLHDGVILVPRPECFVKMLSYSNLSFLLRIKQLVKLA